MRSSGYMIRFALRVAKTAQEIARNMFIVPTASVTASDAENIGAFGAMNRYTTSFQIPNGTIDEYWDSV